MSEKKKATGYKCTNCGRVGHIPGFRCLDCKNSEFEEIELGEECELLTYTRVRSPLSGIEGDPPLLIGMFEFPSGVQIIGQIAGAEPKSIESGKKFKPIWDVVRKIEDEKVYGLKFELIKNP